MVSRVIHCNFMYSVCMNLELFGGQALCSTVGQQPGRRTANGVDGQRLALLLAVSYLLHPPSFNFSYQHLIKWKSCLEGFNEVGA